MPSPKVSILLLTYDHERFLPQAFAGILEQKVNFVYEIHVALDFSPDNSLALVQNFQKEYPERVFVHAAPAHIGGQANVIRGYRFLTGEYVCVLDGDDYWVDAHKLQSQVDFLDANPDYVGAAHNTLLVYEGAEKPAHNMIPDGFKATHEISDVAVGDSYFHVSSLLWRNVFSGELPKPCYHKKNAGDWLMSILYSQFGKIYYDQKVMSVYRINPKGVWSSQSEIQRTMHNIDAMEYYNRVLKYKYRREYERIWWGCHSLLEVLQQKNIGWPFRQKYELLQKSVSRSGRYSHKHRLFGYAYQLMKWLAQFYKLTTTNQASL